jgi:redox-sensing transcriptional repressor
MTETRVPVPTLERLAIYLRVLLDAHESGIQTLSSQEMEQYSGISAAQFRKDLSYFGEFGKPGVGYSVQGLIACIERILRLDEEQPILLVGAGNIGSALVGYPKLSGAPPAHRRRVRQQLRQNRTPLRRPDHRRHRPHP